MTTLLDHDPPITGDMIKADRKRRKMSRSAYKVLTGLTEARQSNLEQGKAEKPGDYETLCRFIFDPELGAVAAGTSAAAPEASHQPVEGEGASAPSTVEEAPLAGADGSIPVAEAPSSPTPPVPEYGEQPVELISGEELDDPEALEDEIITPGSGLPSKIEFGLDGYHITNSELQTFKRCRRKWYLAYYRELKLIRPALTGARSIGTRLHLALAAHYSSRHEDPMKVLEHTILEDATELESRGDAIGIEDLEKDAQLARIMLEGYLEWVEESGVDEGLDVVGDEVIVEAPFATAEQVNWHQPIILMGKMDLRLRRRVDGARLFLDHKSVGSLKEPLKTLHMNEQMLHYHLLEYLDMLEQVEKGEPVEYARGGLYNMLRKVKRTARANPPFYDRVEVPHNTYELQSYWKRVFGEILQIVELRKSLDAGAEHQMVAYPTPTGNCSWDCDFITVCPLFDDGSAAEQMLGDLYEAGNPHAYYAPYGDNATGTIEEG